MILYALEFDELKECEPEKREFYQPPRGLADVTVLAKRAVIA